MLQLYKFYYINMKKYKKNVNAKKKIDLLHKLSQTSIEIS